MNPRSEQPGTTTSEVEVTNVSPHGFWLLVDACERFLSFEEFPWFKNASIEDLTRVERPRLQHLYWPKLDVDLSLDSIDDPSHYPLVAREPGRPNRRFVLIEFVETFSRFEFALKQSGFAESQGKNPERLSVNWSRFAAKHRGHEIPLNQQRKFRALIDRPPMKQKLKEGCLEWKEEGTPAIEEIDLEWLLRMTYRVRNNLFHGGKWPPDPARDVELLKAAIQVIRFCISLDDAVRTAYQRAA